MKRLRRWSRTTGWIAVLAMLSLTVVPAMSRALHAEAASALCTAQGLRSIVGPGQGPDRADRSAVVAALDHCALCMLSGGPLGAPAASGHARGIDPGRTGAAANGPMLPLARPERRAAQEARAPPAG